MAEDFVGSPVFGEFDDGAVELAVVLFELRLEAGEEGEGVGCGASETGEDLAVIETAELPGVGLENFAAEGD